MVGRYAFTMIELIFAIVIIGITVVSLPMMNQAISKGIDSNLQQEAIFAAATKLNETVTAFWDDNSVESISALSKVIDTLNDCNNTSSSPRYRLRPGHVNQPLHRRCLDSTLVGISNSNPNGNVVALNEMAGTSSLFISTAGSITNASSYKKDYNSTVTVNHNSITANSVIFNGAANDYMKMIQVDIKSGTDTITSLRAYSANIGEIDYYKKEY